MANINIPKVILVIIESMSCVVRSIGKMSFFFLRARKNGAMKLNSIYNMPGYI